MMKTNVVAAHSTPTQEYHQWMLINNKWMKLEQETVLLTYYLLSQVGSRLLRSTTFFHNLTFLLPDLSLHGLGAKQGF